jgi:hypothetical protein
VRVEKVDKVYGLGRCFLGKAAAQENLIRMEAAMPAERESLKMALMTLAIRVRVKS